MKPFEYINYEVNKSVAWIRFNRPEQLNAMNYAMMNEIIRAIGIVNTASEDEIKICILTGEGKAFMAGADIKEYAKQNRKQFVEFQTMGRSLYLAIEGNSKPVIAAINGYAFGGGFEIALTCDMILASENAKMGLPEIHLNLIPGGGGTQRLPRKIGVNLANELIMTGKTVTAGELNKYGLINHIYPADEFSDKVKEFAVQLTDKAPGRLCMLKQLIKMSEKDVEISALSLESEALSRYYQSAEGQEKIQEFYKKSQKKKSGTNQN